MTPTFHQAIIYPRKPQVKNYFVSNCNPFRVWNSNSKSSIFFPSKLKQNLQYTIPFKIWSTGMLPISLPSQWSNLVKSEFSKCISHYKSNRCQSFVQCFQVLGYNASCFLFTGEGFWGQDPYGDPREFIGFKGSIQYRAYSCMWMGEMIQPNWDLFQKRVYGQREWHNAVTIWSL